MATTAQRREAVAVAAPSAGSKPRFTWAPYLFILPHLLLFAIFVGYPFFNGLYISLFESDYLRPARDQVRRLTNYVDLFTPGSVDFQTFWNSLGNTGKFVVYSVPLLVVIPLLLAVLLNTKTPGRNIFRAIYFAPWVLSVAVAGLLWWWIFQSQGGSDQPLPLRVAHLQPQWLASLPWAWVAIVVCTIWWTMGFNTIILLAALQDIPDFLYEAASLDGATGWKAFWKITLPMLQPVLLFIVTITIIASFNLFGQPFIMTGGGPGLSTGGGGTEPVMMRIYTEAFGRNRQGTGAAMSVVVATIMIVISYLNFRFFRQRD